ncbi:hypothetical protein DXG01_012418 [Tephrocybe rancida]|nr:hypothetical protein DXG01_012418 [Tephrocybe rancida]
MAASTPQTRTRTGATKREKYSPLKSRTKAKSKSTSRQPSSSSDDDQDDEYQAQDDNDEVQGGEGSEDNAYVSDAIDEDDFVIGTKRKRGASSSSRSPKKSTTASSQKKKVKTKKNRDDEDEDELELEDGQEVVGVVIQAPKTGQEPVYRQAENEWKAFIEALTEHVTETDPQVPPLPPKDLIHRIYRDVRFSNDKTPYKKGFSASFSRSGRKGIWAGSFSNPMPRETDAIAPIHSAVKPGNESILAAGLWCPGRNELANIRGNIQRPAGADRLREVLSNPTFVEFFGEPRPAKDGARQSVFGMDDELKVAPKGVDKTHSFLDGEVLAENFAEKVSEVVGVMRPFVHCLNDMMTVAPDDSEEGTGSGED